MSKSLIERLRADAVLFDVNPEDDVQGLNATALLEREAAIELERLNAEVERLRKDARRYQWLRCCTVAKFREISDANIIKGKRFDGIIDEAIAAAEANKKGKA